MIQLNYKHIPFFKSFQNASGLHLFIKIKKECGLVNLNFIIAVLCVTMLGIVAMLLGFCYKQEIMKALFQSKTSIKADEFSSEITLNLDKKESNK